jgi:hypothetical protein
MTEALAHNAVPGCVFSLEALVRNAAVRAGRCL